MNRLGRHKEVIAFGQDRSDNFKAQIGYIQALMINGDVESIQKVIKLMGPWHFINYAYLFNVHFPPEATNIFEKYLRENLDYFKDPKGSGGYLLYTQMFLLNNESKAFVHYVLKEFGETERILLEIRNTDWVSFTKDTINYNNLKQKIYMTVWLEGLLGSTYARQGKTNLALEQIEILELMKSSFPKKINRFHRGMIPYDQARIYALLGEKEKAVTQLSEALNEGRIIDGGNFIYDWDLMGLKGYKAYEDLVRPQ